MDQTTTIILFAVNMAISAAVGYGAAALKLGRLLQRVDHLDEDNKETKKDVKDLGKSVTKCETLLSINKKETYGISQSPVSLNTRGKEVLDESKAMAVITTNQTDLIQKIKELGVSTAYDVQENSLKVLTKLAEEKDARMNGLKEYAFQKGIDLEIVLWVTALALRDIALPELGFTAEDVDKSDPTKKHIS